MKPYEATSSFPETLNACSGRTATKSVWILSVRIPNAIESATKGSFSTRTDRD